MVLIDFDCSNLSLIDARGFAMSLFMRRSVLFFLSISIASPDISGAFLFQQTSLSFLPQLNFVKLHLKSVSQSNKVSESSAGDVSNGARLKRSSGLTEWAKKNGIEIGGLKVGSSSPTSGLGLIATQNLNKGDVLVQVPTDVALTVQTPTDDNSEMLSLLQSDSNGKDVYRSATWWAQLSLQLNALDQNLISGGSLVDLDMRTWLDSLPRKFNTPIHWSKNVGALEELQYKFMKESVMIQDTTWKSEFDKIKKISSSLTSSLSYDDFVWGCECARSRAFSGAYSGSAFNPAPYAFTLLLVAIYVGLNLGTVEQAANGAAVVVCGSILNDFVLPKLFKTKRYIICPFIDMANHVGIGETGEVAFEYFSDGYSLAVKHKQVQEGEEFVISYGTRSNDQLLQYYGFVEQGNPHDVYVMPPLREWDIEALEVACGRKFNTGRLQKLDRAGLLGSVLKQQGDDDKALRSDASKSGPANEAGGVVITRAGGTDPAVMQALRALVSSDEEWEAAGEAVGNFAVELSGGDGNERLARLAAKTALEMELLGKPTTIMEDEKLLKTSKSSKSLKLSDEEALAIMFRIEKKKLLRDTIESL